MPLGPPTKSRLHDGEVIADFAVVGTLMSIDLLVHQEVENGGLGTLILLAGLGGGAAGGWVLTQKYDVDAAAAHSTTIGLLVGAANGALLIRPTGAYDADQVLALLLLGSALGTVGGFAYGQAADLTPGQAAFIGNTTLLGTSTAAFGAIVGSQNGTFDTWENGTLALGLDAGVVLGAVIAPSLDWSPRRAKLVFASTLVGSLVGGMISGLLTNKQRNPDGSTDTDNDELTADVIAGAMTAGMWAGFGLGVVLTRDSAPDPSFTKPRTPPTTPTARATPATPMTFAPWISKDSTLGVMTGGAF